MSVGLQLLMLKTLSERSQPCVTHPAGLKCASEPQFREYVVDHLTEETQV